MNKIVLMIGLLLVTTVSTVVAGSYNYIDKGEFKDRLESGKNMVIIDIQEEEAFAKHHFPGSIETNAFPVKTNSQRQSIDPAVKKAKASSDDVVVICPRGGGGAKRCYDYLKQQGVSESRIYILKGGVDKWPHRYMLEKGSNS